jgi:hypothetical protein
VAADPDPDEISEETRLMAVQVRAMASRLPLGAELATLAADAMLSRGEHMSPAEIRHLGVTAARQAQQVSYLLGKLAGLIGDEDDCP